MNNVDEDLLTLSIVDYIFSSSSIDTKMKLDLANKIRWKGKGERILNEEKVSYLPKILKGNVFYELILLDLKFQLDKQLTQGFSNKYDSQILQNYINQNNNVTKFTERTKKFENVCCNLCKKRYGNENAITMHSHEDFNICKFCYLYVKHMVSLHQEV